MLELFAGTRCVGKIAESLWMRVISLDIDPKHRCDLVMDILDFDPFDYCDICPDIIWASPDCTTFSFASSWFYRDKLGNAKNEKARHGDRILEKTLEIIEHYLKKNSSMKYYVENPRGNMAKQKTMIDFLEWSDWFARLITFCSYWYPYRKPTHIFTNDLSWQPKPRCGYKTPEWSGNSCCHVPVPRCTSAGIVSLWRAGDKRRSLIPNQLILELLQNPN